MTAVPAAVVVEMQVAAAVGEEACAAGRSTLSRPKCRCRRLQKRRSACRSHRLPLLHLLLLLLLLPLRQGIMARQHRLQLHWLRHLRAPSERTRPQQQQQLQQQRRRLPLPDRGS